MNNVQVGFEFKVADSTVVINYQQKTDHKRLKIEIKTTECYHTNYLETYMLHVKQWPLLHIIGIHYSLSFVEAILYAWQTGFCLILV